MASFIFRETQDTDDAQQNAVGTGGYAVTGQTNGLHLNAATAAVGTSTVAGMYFTGDIPIGTTSIPYGSISVWVNSSTVAVGTNVPFKIYAQANITPNALKTTGAAGTNDLSPAQRTRTTAFSQINYTLGPNQNDEWRISADTWKELLTLAGATSWTGTGTDADPYISGNGTTSVIHNLVFLCVGDTLTVGASPSSAQLSILSYDVYTADTSAAKFATKTQTPALNISTVDVSGTVAGTDERLHVFLFGDSLTWPYAPELTGDGIPFDTLYTGLDPLGNIITTGIQRLGDGTIDIIPAGYSYGGVNRGYTTVKQGTQWYTIIDPDGSLYNHGRQVPEGRSGYTKFGCYKDALCKMLKLRPEQIVVHSFGYGGTTASRWGGTTGTWSEAGLPGVTAVKLDTITDPTAAAASVTNPLWNRNRDQTGKTAVQVLMDSTIKYFLALGSVDGNDLFLQYTGNTKALTLPISGSAGAVASAVSQMTTDNTTIWSFIKRMRDHYTTLPSAVNEYHHIGYYNFQAEDPRVPPIVINIGPPASAAMHRGTYVSLANPDPEYGGPNPSPGDKMAPYGNTGQSHPAASPGVGSVNAMPQVPLTLLYPFATLFPGFNRPRTNIVGQAALCNWTTPRAFFKDDIDIFHQMLMGDRCGATWKRDFNTVWRDWFAHWAADTTYSNVLYSEVANSAGWNDAFGKFQNNPTQNTFPQHSCYGSPGVYNIPLDNMAVAIPYTGRNINNQTLNECVHATCGAAASAVMATLAAGGDKAFWIDMRLVLPSQVGSGTTASADRWAYHEGIHPTFYASILMSQGLVTRQLAAGSPIINHFATVGAGGMFLSMM